MSIFAKIHNQIKIKKTSSTIKKSVVGLILSLSAIGMVACGENQSGSGTGPTNNYSELLNGILNNDTYNSYIRDVEIKSITTESAVFDPHPYAFYASKGYSVTKIKDGFLPAKTKAYTLAAEPNNLYMLTYCADNTNTYYNEFTLRYTLTDKEMAEYRMLHENRYIQAVFMNDAISASRSPEILTECKCGITAHKEINSSVGDLTPTKNLIGDYGTDILFRDFDEPTQKFSINIFPNVGFSTPYSMVEQRWLGIYYFKCILKEMDIKNGAYIGPTNFSSYQIDTDLFDPTDIYKYRVSATWYTSQYASLNINNQLNK